MPRRAHNERVRDTLLPEAAFKPQPATTEAKAPGAASRRLRILMAEDAADHRLLIAACLRRLPFDVDIAENGRNAVEKFTAPGAYDLVLMDLQMPEMDGLTATRVIRAWERAAHLPPTPIIALSAATLDRDIQQALEAGCNALMCKPVRRSALLAQIQELLARFEARPAPVAPASSSPDAKRRSSP